MSYYVYSKPHSNALKSPQWMGGWHRTSKLLGLATEAFQSILSPGARVPKRCLAPAASASPASFYKWQGWGVRVPDALHPPCRRKEYCGRTPTPTPTPTNSGPNTHPNTTAAPSVPTRHHLWHIWPSLVTTLGIVCTKPTVSQLPLTARTPTCTELHRSPSWGHSPGFPNGRHSSPGSRKHSRPAAGPSHFPFAQSHSPLLLLFWPWQWQTICSHPSCCWSCEWIEPSHMLLSTSRWTLPLQPTVPVTLSLKWSLPLQSAAPVTTIS